MMGGLEAFIIAGVTGVISSVGTIAALKIEIAWLKSTIEKLEIRLNNHSSRINILERATACQSLKKS